MTTPNPQSIAVDHLRAKVTAGVHALVIWLKQFEPRPDLQPAREPYASLRSSRAPAEVYDARRELGRSC